MLGIKSKQTPYQGLWIFLPIMFVPSVVITLLLHFVIARWQPQYTAEFNWATSKMFGFGSGVLFHFGCWIAGAFDEDFKVVKMRLKDFCENITVSFKLAFSGYWEDVKTFGLAYWIDVAVVLLNAGIFLDALLKYIEIRGR